MDKIEKLIADDVTHKIEIRLFYFIVFQLNKKLQEAKSIENVDEAIHQDEDKLREYLENTQKTFYELIMRCDDQLRSDSRFRGGNYYAQVEYIYAAYIDEILMNTPWVGSKYWKEYLVEDLLFKTKGAGDTIFNRIDFLLKHRATDNLELAKLYLMVLGSGFKGRYFSQGYEPIAQYKRALYTYIYGTEPTLVQKDRIFKKSYSVVPSQKAKLLPIFSQHIVKYGVVFLIFLVVDIILWNVNVAPIKDNFSIISEQVAKFISQGKSNS